MTVDKTLCLGMLVAAALLASCSGNNNQGDPTPDAGSEPDVLIDVGDMSDGGVQDDGLPEVDFGSDLGDTPLAFVTPPTLTLSEAAPLAGMLELETNLPTQLSVNIAADGESWDITVEEPATVHSQAVVGLRPDRDYVLTVVANGEEDEVEVPIAVSTDPLPDDFPPIDVSTSEPAMMEPGWTLFNVRGPGWVYLMMVDDAGDVRWFHRDDSIVSPRNDHELLPNGHLLCNSGVNEIVELDLLGGVVDRWHAANYPDETYQPPTGSIAVDAETFHHEVGLMPNGNLFSLGTEMRTYDDYPDAVVPPANLETANVVGDVVVEFQRDGTVVNEIALLDVLDPRRLQYGSLGGFWDSRYGVATRDWSHANSLFYDDTSDAFLVSVRHQDATVKIARSDGSLIWILGTPANWTSPWDQQLLTPEGTLDWPFHQHAVTVTPDGGIGMFDNGNHRASPPDPSMTNLYSRAVKYAVDEQAMTVAQAFSYGPDSGADSFYARFISDADWMPQTQNVLVTPGGQSDGDVDFAQVLEVTSDGTRVFELTVQDPARSLTTYRASRIPDLTE